MVGSGELRGGGAAGRRPANDAACGRRRARGEGRPTNAAREGDYQRAGPVRCLHDAGGRTDDRGRRTRGRQAVPENRPRQSSAPHPSTLRRTEDGRVETCAVTGSARNFKLEISRKPMIVRGVVRKGPTS